MKKSVMVWICFALVCACSCRKDLLEYRQGDLKIYVEQGDNWLHDFPLFMGIKLKNPPQIAIWMEDTQGAYLSTVYASHKIATQSWQMNGGNPRKEALPHWQHSRALKNADGVSGATPRGGIEIKPLADGISGATPRGSFDVKIRPNGTLKQFVVKIEVNHSTDFNDYYTETAKEGEPNYSGGKEGSGQPAIVYAADVDLSTGATSFEAVLIGHSSPDGTSGRIDADMSHFTTAIHIVKRITVNIKP
jgi:hypothetical protein